MHKRLGRGAGLAAIAAVLCASSALGGVNRWTTHWPSEAYARQVVIDPVNSDFVYAPTDSGLFKSGDGGLSWKNLLRDVNVHCVAIDPETASVQVGTANGILASTDGGASWSSRLAAHAIETLVFGPQHTTYAADFDYPNPSTLYKSADDGTTWTAVALPFPMLPGSLVIDPTRPSTLYAGISPAEFATTFFHVTKSLDGGVTWSTLDVLTHGALVMDPQNPATLYVGDDGGVSKSLDSGSTWSYLSSPDLTGLDVVALAFDPSNPSTLYAGTYDAGVFRSIDGGASWKKFGAGLPHEFVYSLSIDSTGKRLHAVGVIDGVFDYQIFTGALDLAVGSDNASLLLFTDADAHLTFRSVDNAGDSTSVGPYGPYSGWFPTAVADGSDGLTRVLWNNPDGSAALWLYGASGNQASFRLGPVQGWKAVDVAA